MTRFEKRHPWPNHDDHDLMRSETIVHLALVPWENYGAFFAYASSFRAVCREERHFVQDVVKVAVS